MTPPPITAEWAYYVALGGFLALVIAFCLVLRLFLRACDARADALGRQTARQAAAWQRRRERGA